MFDMITKFLKQDPDNWKWLILIYGVALICIILLTLKL